MEKITKSKRLLAPSKLADKKFLFILIIAVFQILFFYVRLNFSASYPSPEPGYILFASILIILVLIRYKYEYTNIPFVIAALVDIYYGDSGGTIGPYNFQIDTLGPIIQQFSLPIGVFLLVVFLIIPFILKLRELFLQKLKNPQKENGWLLSSISIGYLIAFIQIAVIPGAFGINYCGSSLNLFYFLSPFLIILIGIILHRTNNYGYWSIPVLLAAWFVSQGIIGVAIGPISCPPIGMFCLVQSGYICQSPILHNSVFIVVLGQRTGTNWENVNFLWVPQNAKPPPIGYSCPASGKNATGSGLSCATPNSISLVSGNTTSETFTFSEPAPVGSTYYGTIWAVYQTNVGGTWYEVQIASATLKAV